MTSTPKPPEDRCTIVIVNDVTGQRQIKYSPQSVEEALLNDGDVERAKHFLDLATLYGTADDDELIGVAIRHNERIVIVHWYPMTDDLEAARVAWCDVLSGHWRARR